MHSAPTDKKVADAMSISEVQVARYRREVFKLGDGSWLIHFELSMPRELRANIEGRFTLIIRPPDDANERRAQDLC